MNCHRNYPWYKGWEKEFAGRPFQVIGIHTPETGAERNEANVRSRIKRDGFTFPVVIDSDESHWKAWGNSVWPAVYLIDREGYLRYWWYGELNWKNAGMQKVMQQRIEELLAERS